MLGKRFGRPNAARAWWTETAARVAAAEDEEGALRELATFVARDIDPYAFGIFLENPATRELVLKHRFAHGPLWNRPIAVPADQGLVGFVFRHGVPLVVHDVAQDPRYLRGPLADAKSALAVPVRAAGEVIGALDIESDVPWTFDGEDIEAMSTLASALGSALARIRRSALTLLQKR